MHEVKATLGYVLKFHRLTPHAADPWSLTINLAQIRMARGWGAAPSGPPLLSAPQRLFALSRPSHLSGGSRAAWGRTFSQKSDFRLNKPLVRGSCAAWGRTVSLKSVFFKRATCPGQLRCLGQNLFSRKSYFFEQKVTQAENGHAGRGHVLP